MIISASLRDQRLPWSNQNMRASCMVSVEAPCPLRPSFTSTYAALTMRIGSNPLCWKKRLSSADVTASTSTVGISRNLTKRRFSRFAPERFVMSCGSSWYCGRDVLSCSDTIDRILPSANLMTPGSWSKYESCPGNTSIDAGCSS
jgi:hypothetical protein